MQALPWNEIRRKADSCRPSDENPARDEQHSFRSAKKRTQFRVVSYVFLCNEHIAQRMIEIHRAKDRGKTKASWLESYHSFSFGDWYDPKRMGFGPLRVLNDDIIAAGGGFPSHGHRDMEIVTIVLSGALAHKDSTGGSGVIKPGEVQHMSAGSGIVHSEFNASDSEPASLLQIWIQPKERGIAPNYSQQPFHLTRNKLTRIVDGEGRDGALKMHQDATFWLGEFDEEEKIALNMEKSYVFIISGSVSLNGEELHERDAAAVEKENYTSAKSTANTKVLVIELPK
jgi:redox-sensitive bicupin YhaK (pirin superfamily)